MSNYYKKVKIPVRVVVGNKEKGKIMKSLKLISKIISCLFLAFSVIISQSALLSAFEAHVVNVTATIEDGIADYLVINKVYYDVDAEHGVEPDNEWVELYNPTDFPIDVSGWQICDNISCDELPSGPPIPSQGFALIITDATPPTQDFWEIPIEIVQLQLTGSAIGNGLANTADMLILKDDEGNIVDQMNWGIPNPDWPNYNDDVWNPGVPVAPEGHMLARVPNGFDTNRASDWKELGLPQVAVTYPTGGGWYCNQNVTLKWTATNPNGPNSDLKITLLYIRDLDKNGVVSSGDAITTIAQDIANTGSYNWKVSPCYYGWVWIKVIAVGPENFMANDSGLSGRVFEPTAPEEVSLEELPEDCCSIEMFAQLLAEYEASLNLNEIDQASSTEATGNSSGSESQPSSDGENVVIEPPAGEESSATSTLATSTDEELDDTGTPAPEAAADDLDNGSSENSEDIPPEEESISEDARVEQENSETEEIVTEESVTEEQPAIVPDNGSPDPGGTSESADEGSGNGTSDDSVSVDS